MYEPEGTPENWQTPRWQFDGGSIESPKLLRRSGAFASLPDGTRELVGRGLTDHPTTNEIATLVTGIDDVRIPRLSNIKIIFYSKGKRDGGPPPREEHHFMSCPVCGQAIDMRDLRQVLWHDEPGHEPLELDS